MFDIPILMLHSVNDNPEQSPMGDLSVSSKGLVAYLDVLKKWKYQMISMDDLLCGRYDKDRNFIVLTFDDGYKDNLTVALPILKKYNARATIFVNPAYTSLETEKNSNWGFMTWNEINSAEKSGVFDIQAHTMTHEFIFVSDKVVDYYTPEKFSKYYWLSWILFPDSPGKWNTKAMVYRDLIPIGYPIFEYDRRLSKRKFTPNQEYIDYLINSYRTNSNTNFVGNKGEYESLDEFLSYSRWEIIECKKELEQRLDKKIHTVCFPGGGYTDDILAIAEKAGYRCYMNASKLRVGNNNDNIDKVHKEIFTGLNRTSFSIIHIKNCPEYALNYCIAKLSLGSFQNIKRYTVLKRNLSRLIRR